jgi:hypothetical protein
LWIFSGVEEFSGIFSDNNFQLEKPTVIFQFYHDLGSRLSLDENEEELVGPIFEG